MDINHRGKEKIIANLRIVHENMMRAAARSGRAPEAVKLLVVTKGHPWETIREVLDAGEVHLGENYVEEAATKIQLSRGSYSCFWHMIGHVQSRKSASVIELFDFVHSLDSVKLAQRFSTAAQLQKKVMPVLLEFNLSGESTKSGWLAANDADWPALLSDLEIIVSLSNLDILGLMTMAPYSENPENSRIYYRKLRELQGFLRKKLPQSSWKELSMGMSGDYEVAIEEGATWIRIGQAILGPRAN
jgi:pyridoxal phosphate enzyme (YggS family)